MKIFLKPLPFLMVFLISVNAAAMHPLLPSFHNAMRKKDHITVSHILFGIDLTFMLDIDMDLVPAGWYSYRAELIETLLNERNSEGENSDLIASANFTVRIFKILNFARSVVHDFHSNDITNPVGDPQ